MNFAPAPVRAGRPVSRNLLIAGGVVAFHVAALWGLQSGLLRRAVEVVVPVELLSQLIEPPKLEEPPPPPPAPPKPPPPPPVRQPVPKKAPVLPPPPMPAAIPDPTPAPAAPVGVVEPQPPAPPISAPVEIAAPPPAPPAPEPRVELPSSDADYLQNPTPVYPAISRRLGEQGRVMVRVLIGADGLPQRATVRSSSGFQRLDQAATDTVMRWRFVPGKRGGVPEAMWFNVPINFVLE